MSAAVSPGKIHGRSGVSFSAVPPRRKRKARPREKHPAGSPEAIAIVRAYIEQEKRTIVLFEPARLLR